MFTQAERQAILEACRPDERPTVLSWFNTGLRPGKLQALEWEHIDWQRRVARIVQKLAGVIKDPKTEAGKREVNLNGEAIQALRDQLAISGDRGKRVWLNTMTLVP